MNGCLRRVNTQSRRGATRRVDAFAFADEDYGVVDAIDARSGRGVGRRAVWRCGCVDF